ADPGDAARREIVEPRGVEPVELGSGTRAAVADPRLGVLLHRLLLALDHPRVEALAPARDPIEAVVAVAVLPVAEQLRDAAVGEMVADAPDHRLDDPVAHEPAVAVLVRRHPRRARRDHER